MATRRRLEDEPTVRQPPMTRERLQKHLAVNMDALDDCLIDQPEHYYHAAVAAAEATARRDALKLDLEEAEAEESKKLRELAFQRDEKVTEASLKQQLKLIKRLQNLERDHLEHKAEADKWAALRDSFKQRSYLLPELVAMHLSRLSRTSVSGAMTDLSEARREQAGRLRSSRSPE